MRISRVLGLLRRPGVAALVVIPLGQSSVFAEAERSTLLSETLHHLDETLKVQVISLCLVYPRSDSVKAEPAAASATYDGTAASFKVAVAELKRNPELFGMGIRQSALDVLECMERNFADLSLDLVEAIIIQREGAHVVRLNNKAKTELKPPTGRVCFLDVNDVRLRAAAASNHAKAAMVNKGVEWANSQAMNVVVASLTAAAVALATRGRMK